MRASTAEPLDSGAGSRPGALSTLTNRLRGDSAVPLLGMIAVSALMLRRANAYWGFTLDDAFITLRYAKHVAQGFGPAWNLGAEPVEGYTTVLWMVILALAQTLGVDGLLFAKASGVVFGIAAVGVGVQLAREVCLTAGFDQRCCALAALVVFALSASYWPLGLHAVSGMETSFSCLMLTAFFCATTRARRSETQPSYRLLASSALLATLARPEAGLACAASLAAYGWFGSSIATRRIFLRTTCVWFLLPGAVYLSARWLHFGLLFPLSFYVKATGQPWLSGLPNVVGFFAPFVVEQPWWGLLFLAGCARAPALRPALVGAASFALFFIFPEHIMAFESRYLLPLFPLLSAVAGIGAAGVAHYLSTTAWSGGMTKRALTVLGSMLAVLGCWSFPGDPVVRAQTWLDYGASLQRAHVALAQDLAGAKARGGRIALLDVGAVGYYADWDTIDTFGLNDAHVALTHRKDIEYVLAKRPDLLVVVSADSGDYRTLFEWEEPLHRAALARGYRALCEYTFDPNYNLQVLARPGPETVLGGVCKSSSRRLRSPALPR